MLPSLTALCALLMVTSSAPAAEPSPATDAPAAQDVVEKKKKFRLFPSRKKAAKRAEAPDEDPAADAHAASHAPSQGIWEWVDRMEGEIPSPEQVQALEERAEEELAQRALIDDLSGGDVPEAFYADPEAELTAPDPLHLAAIDPSEFDIPVDVNPRVEKWMRYILGNGRKYYSKWLARSTRYRPMMIAQLEEAGLPRDLVYVSMVESGYSTHAYSHASAAGLWQFIPSTAKLYKLRVDWWVDDRRDPERSLGAAMAFLGELHEMFGDWRLAWAAYNTGPGRVRRAISRSGSRDFWTIEASPHLPAETDNYVPMIMAAAIIGKHPERYGFTDIAYQDELKYEVAHVDGSVELEVLADCAGTTVAEIKSLNPALRRYATPPEGHHVRLPVGKRERFVAALASVPVSKRVTVARHTVRRGETLSAIAGRYGVTVSDISRANGLKNINRIYVGMSLVVPSEGRGGTAIAETSSSRRRASGRPSAHTVAKGDTLSGIAARYGVSVADLQGWNDLSDSRILLGQRLSLGGSGGGSAPAVSTYTVRKGDTLSVIAARLGVQTSELQRVNGIRNASHITVGQTLQVPRGGTGGTDASWSTVTVASGDSLGRIASRHGCSVKDLQSWNGLASTVIHPGQKLRVKK